MPSHPHSRFSQQPTMHPEEPTTMKGYFQHPTALVESPHIGRGTRVWANAHVLPRARIGRDCNICDGVFIENDVVVGDRVTIKCGVQLWDGITLEDDVFVGPNATFTNDPFPRSRRPPSEFSRTLVRKGASIGANATILPGLTVGVEALVGAGAVVTRDVPRNARVLGNPARIVGYVGSDSALSPTKPATQGSGTLRQLRVAGPQLYQLPLIRDLRGALTFGEVGRPIPFEPRRFFVVYDVPSKEVRGEHAHRKLHEFLVCLRGKCSVALDDGRHSDEAELDSPSIGLHVPPQIWRVHYKYSADAMLLVLASDEYDAGDYIRDYDEFLRELQ